jgi:phenylpropionate dioxygenase-like ring-hydroxylating dioxygenase large terminal subunit
MYHGWTYATDGALVGVPLRKGYAADFDLKAKELGMLRVPRMQSYRGMVFASLNAEGPDLEDHLGAMKSSIDDIVDRAPDGEIQLNNGVFKYSIESNWKILVENSLDSYHAPFTHECTVSQSGAQFARREGDEGGVKLLDRKSAVSNYGDKGVWVFDGGHGYTGALPMSAKASSSPVYREYVALLEARHGPERTKEILTPNRHNSMVYPNLVVQSLNYQFRVIRPVAVDRTEVHVYPIRLKGAPEELNRQSIRHVNVTHSPASFIQPEDFEAFERCQRGLEAEGAEWVQFARGLDRHLGDQDRVGLKSDGTHEIQMRNQYRVWLDYMSESA